MDALLRTWAGLTAGLVTGGEPGTEDSTRLDGSNIDPARIADLSRLLLDTSTDRRHRIVSQLSPDERVALADSLTPGQLGRVLGPLTEHCTRDVWAALLHRAAHSTSHRTATTLAVSELGANTIQAAWAVKTGAMDAAAEQLLLEGADLTRVGDVPYTSTAVIRLVAALRPLTVAEQQHLVDTGKYTQVGRNRIDARLVAGYDGPSPFALAEAAEWLLPHHPDLAAHLLDRRLAGGGEPLTASPDGLKRVAHAAARCSPSQVALLEDAVTANAEHIADALLRNNYHSDTAWRTWAPTSPPFGLLPWPVHAESADGTFDAPLAVLAACGYDAPAAALSWAVAMWVETGTFPSAAGLADLYANHPQVPGLALAAGEWWNPDADVTGLAELISTAVRQCAGEGEVELYSISHAPSAPPVRLAQALDGDAFLWAVGSGQIPAAGWLSGTIAGPDVTADTIRAVTEALYLDVDAAIAGLNTHPDLVAILADRAPVRILQPQHRTRLNREAFRQLTGWLRQHLGDNPSTWDWLDRESRLRHYDTYRLGNSVASALGVLH